jgi:hypothetical protein
LKTVARKGLGVCRHPTRVLRRLSGAKIRHLP